MRKEVLLLIVFADGFDWRITFFDVCDGFTDSSSLLSSRLLRNVLPPGDTWLMLLLPSLFVFWFVLG